MDAQVHEWLRWALDGLGALAALYAKITHTQIKEERAAREEAISAMGQRLINVELQMAATARDSEVIKNVQEKLDKLAGVVYMMAGQMGIKTPG